MRIGVIGKDGRTAAIVRALRESRRQVEVVVLSHWKERSAAEALDHVLERARAERPDLVVIGPEAPLAAGVADALESHLDIPSVGPLRALARIETSKSFARDLLRQAGIPGNPYYRVFRVWGPDIERCLRELGDFVIKPDGLTGGKGVKVWGAHLTSLPEALDYCRELLRANGSAIVVEERLDGEEFSLQSFTDGEHVVHMPAVQDHKRAYEDDLGPNTGGMGSYSCENHSLPFLTESVLAEARAINEAVVAALRRETGRPYRGILYGGFIATRDGVRVIEYNARFGDPEALNVLSVLATDFADVCEGIVMGRLNTVQVAFRPEATVCKYIVPAGYPDRPAAGAVIDRSRVLPESAGLRYYPAAVEERDGDLILTASRGIAVVGIGPTLGVAFERAEEAASRFGGPVYYRRDIGSEALVGRRVAHMAALMGRKGTGR